MILILDNYDSFVFNLARYCEELGYPVAVFRNDALELEDIGKLGPDAIILSPGPGRPEEAGIMVDLVKSFSGEIPILGVCLGHQAIGKAFGADIIHAQEPMHGRASLVTHTRDGIFHDMPQPMSVARYHSLVIAKTSLPDCLHATAYSEDGEIMAIRHLAHLTVGVQFHPESILTPNGQTLLHNFLEQAHAS
ncbi:aminodeoxychorismate/anthranilate synthase component II [uncultured Cohaesibacter sp.]|uniref:anthranilate synthase component II n=1 Tax=uncultured Cohaesibacter sp. TaxID=1002546 RepID=UPI0029319F74|nr:aminodeoxychorismate/anthranilate synthase component II [uncultured Cohaesibacter sp.]